MIASRCLIEAFLTELPVLLIFFVVGRVLNDFVDWALWTMALVNEPKAPSSGCI